MAMTMFNNMLLKALYICETEFSRLPIVGAHRCHLAVNDSIQCSLSMDALFHSSLSRLLHLVASSLVIEYWCRAASTNASRYI